MSGETEQSVSGWTVDTLRQAIMEAIDEHDHRYEQRFEATEKAITKAEAATEKRFESVNELRGQLNDLITTLMPRAEAEQRAAQNTDKIESLSKRISDADYLSRTEYQSRHDDLTNQVNELQRLWSGWAGGSDAMRRGSTSVTERERNRQQLTVAWVVGGIGLFLTLISVAVAVAVVLSR